MRSQVNISKRKAQSLDKNEPQQHQSRVAISLQSRENVLPIPDLESFQRSVTFGDDQSQRLINSDQSVQIIKKPNFSSKAQQQFLNASVSLILNQYPRKALSAYQWFDFYCSFKFRSKNQLLEKQLLIFQKWNKLSKKEREVFTNLEKNDIIREQKQLQEFEAHFQGQNIADLMIQRPLTPKKCRTAYNFYIQDANLQARNSPSKSKPQRGINKTFTENWWNLDSKSKQKYAQMVEKDKERFQSQNDEFSKYGYFTTENGERSTEIDKNKSKRRIFVDTVDSNDTWKYSESNEIQGSSSESFQNDAFEVPTPSFQNQNLNGQKKRKY